MKSDLVTFVVQGPVDKTLTPGVLQSIRRHFPNSKIILSTWKGQDSSSLEFDQIVESDDPGAVLQDEKHHIFDNVNRQITSTRAGLREVKTPYAVKTRTDCMFVSGKLLDHLGQKLKSVAGHQIFQEHILTANYNVKNHRRIPLVFHPSDIVLGGRTLDLMNLFDIPLRTEAETRYGVTHNSPLQKVYPGLLSQYTAETFIWLNCLKKHFPINLVSSYSTNPAVKLESDKYLVANYHVRSPIELGFRFSKYKWRELKSYTSYTHSEWVVLYNQHTGDNLRKPLFDLQLLHSYLWHIGSCSLRALRYWIKMRHS